MGDFVTHYLPSKTGTKVHYDSESQADVTCPDHEEGVLEVEVQGLPTVTVAHRLTALPAVIYSLDV